MDRIVNYRVQVLPASGELDWNVLEQQEVDTADRNQARFFRSWLFYDCHLESICEIPGSSRSSLLGLALALGVGCSFWGAVAILLARLWK
jgi:hypothetical protein